MRQSTIGWHIARDNQLQLARFCEKHKTRSSTELVNEDVFNITYTFNNGGFITAELLRGKGHKSYSVADRFQVIEYALGAE